MSIDKQTIFERTPKGVIETKGRWGIFASTAQKVLALIDGLSTVEELRVASGMKEKKLLDELDGLLRDRLIRETYASPNTQFTINAIPRTQQGIHVTVANIDSFMEAVEKQKSSKKKEKNSEEDLQSFDDVEEKLRRESEQSARREAAERQLQVETKVKDDTERKAREAAEIKAREDAERKEREEAERAREEAKRLAQEEAERQAREARVAKRLEAREKENQNALAEAERKVKEEAERKAKEEAERLAREEAERVAREEAERKAREEAARQAREEAERLAREEAERLEREAAELKAKEEAERKAREEAERIEREAAEQVAREEAERKAREDEARQAQEEAERLAREEAERLEREAAELKAKEEAERKAREEAERIEREEAEQVAREEAERKAREDEARQAREEAERLAREEAERLEREAAELKAKEEAERKAREEAERIEREEAEQVAREEAERKAREDEARQAQEEAERLAREEAERLEREAAELKAKEEAERKAREEAERIEREEAEQVAREEAERKAREEAARQAQEEAERLAREEAERLEREAAELKAKEEAERKAREEAERIEREAAEQVAREEAERKAREEAARQAQEEAARQAREEAERQEREAAELRAKEEAERKAREEAERVEREAAELKARQDAAHNALELAAPVFHVEETFRTYEEAEPGQRVEKALRMLKWGAAGVLVLLLAGLAGIHLVPLSSTQKRLETLVSARLGEPVKMQSLHIALFPSPYLKLRQLEIGSQAGIRIADARIYAGWGTLFGDGRQVERIELEKIDLAAGALESIAIWPAKSVQQQPAYEIGQITFRQAGIKPDEGRPPSFRGELSFSEPGRIGKARLESEDGALKVDFSPSADGLAVSASARDLMLSSFLPLRIDSLQAEGKVSGKQIHFAGLSGSSHGGKVSGSLLLSWDQDWSAKGDIRIDGANIAPAASDRPTVSGKLDASLSFLQGAKTPGNLFRPPLLTGFVTLKTGRVAGFDLPSALHYDVEAIYSAHTDFDSWTFKLEPLGDRQAYKSLRVIGPDLQLEGKAEVSAAGAISGAVKLQVEAKKKMVRGNYSLGGTLERPTIRRATPAK